MEVIDHSVGIIFYRLSVAHLIPELSIVISDLRRVRNYAKKYVIYRLFWSFDFNSI